MCWGLPGATMISSLLRAKVFGWPLARLSSVTRFMFWVLADANRSAGAPCLSCVARDELPA